MKRKPYDLLPLVPTVIAEGICAEPYAMQEFSEGNRTQGQIDKIEALRLKMTPEQVTEFADLAEAKCRKAYAAKAAWFEKLLKNRRDGGLGQLHVWIRHWMAGYLVNPETMRRMAGVSSANGGVPAKR